MHDGSSYLFVLRHGESEANLANAAAIARAGLQLDVVGPDRAVALSPRGIAQAAGAGRWLGRLPVPPGVFVSSPFRRCMETATIAMQAGGLKVPLQTDERLRERALGIVDKLTPLGIRERLPQEAANRERVGKYAYRPPEGESWADVVARLRPFAEEMRQASTQPSTVVVTHQVVVLCLRYLLEDLSTEELLAIDRAGDVGHCAVTTYRRRGDHFLLESYNVSHGAFTYAADGT